MIFFGGIIKQFLSLPKSNIIPKVLFYQSARKRDAFLIINDHDNDKMSASQEEPELDLSSLSNL